MYIDSNDIRSLRDRSPEVGAREGREHPLCACGGKHPPMSAATSSCRGYGVPMGAPLAAVYSPLQIWREIYDEPRALAQGTLFAELDKPFMAKGRKCK